MKKILINHNTWQTRIAITENGRLENVYFSAKETLERAFFKGTVTKVLAGIQTAFVDIGQERAGFLHISDIDRDLAIRKMSKLTQIECDDDQVVESKKSKSSYQKQDISKALKEGDTILVQVGKEPVYEKGAKLTTCFTLPGRFIVLMPNIPRIGISKKIENQDERRRLKDIVQSHLPEGMGCIIRTTSENRGAQEIDKDIQYLVKMWRTIEKDFAKAKPQDRLHDDLDISLQIVRDFLDDQVESIITDDKKNQAEIYQFIKHIAPEYTHTVHLYTNTQIPILDFYGVESQIEEALDRRVTLQSGGSLIIESTEAMTVIDVNTGKFIGKANLEETILKTNLEAALEVARQLRLRNIGGLIVIDFIDMAIPANRQKLFLYFEKILRERDKFQSVVLKVSEFGLVQMTRKRSGKTLLQRLMDTCPRCDGLGVIKSVQTESYTVLSKIWHSLTQRTIPATEKIIAIQVNPAIFEHITTSAYNTILELERVVGKKITLISNKNFAISEYAFEKS